MPKPTLEMNRTDSWRDKGVHAFPKGIRLKMKIIEQIVFEFAYFETAVQHFSN